jgi:hypothetical protein
MIALSRRSVNAFPVQVFDGSFNPPSVNTGTTFSPTSGGLKYAIGFATSSSSA